MYGEKLLEIRKKLMLTQEEIAEKTGTTYRAYSSYERDERNPQLDFLTQLIYLFDVNINWLLANKGDMFITKATQFVQAKDELRTILKELLVEEGIIKQ